MAGPTANVSRDFFDRTKKFAFLTFQQGVPCFDATANFQAKTEHWNRRDAFEGILGHQWFGDGADDSGFTLSEATAPANNFAVGVKNVYMQGSVVEFIADNTASSPVDYTSTNNYLFSGIITQIVSNKIYDSSKSFRTKHYLTGCRVYMTSGAEAGNSFPITSYSNDWVECSGGIGSVALEDTFLILPPALTTPGGSRTDDVYLMLFGDDVDEAEDTDLKDPTTEIAEAHGYGVRWCIRVDEGQAGPWSDDAGYITFHRIGEFARTASADITDAMITNDPDGNKLPQLGTALAELRKGSFFGTSVVTVARDSPAVEYADYHGATALYDAVNALKATTATIFVYGSTSEYSWASPLAITGNIDIVCVGGPVTVNYTTTSPIMTASGVGSRISIRGFPTHYLGYDYGFYLKDGSTAHQALSGIMTLENCLIEGSCIFSSESTARDCMFDANGNTSYAVSARWNQCFYQNIRVKADSATPVAFQFGGENSVVEGLTIDMEGDGSLARIGFEITHITSNSTVRNLLIVNPPNIPSVGSTDGLVCIHDQLIRVFIEQVAVIHGGYDDRQRQPSITVEGLSARSRVHIRDILLDGNGEVTQLIAPTTTSTAGGLIRIDFNTSITEVDQKPIVEIHGSRVENYKATDSYSACFKVMGDYQGQASFDEIYINNWVSAASTAFKIMGFFLACENTTSPVHITIRDLHIDMKRALAGNTTVANEMIGVRIGNTNSYSMDVFISNMTMINVNNDYMMGSGGWPMTAIHCATWPRHLVVNGMYGKYCRIFTNSSDNADSAMMMFSGIHLSGCKHTSGNIVDLTVPGTGEPTIMFVNSTLYDTDNSSSIVFFTASNDCSIAGCIFRDPGGGVLVADVPDPTANSGGTDPVANLTDLKYTGKFTMV